MLKDNHKPELIVIAGPNGSGKTIAPLVDRLYVYDNSIDGQDAKIQFRLVNGIMGKLYVTEVPEWAKIILPDTYEL